MYTLESNAMGSYTIMKEGRAVAFAFSEGMAIRICRLLNAEGY